VQSGSRDYLQNRMNFGEEIKEINAALVIIINRVLSRNLDFFCRLRQDI
jgi:hypothetical protein